MKKLLLILGMVSLVTVKAQKTTVTGTGAVKIMANTLFFNGSGLDITSNTAQVSNDGNTVINSGTFEITNDGTQNQQFINEWTATANYGQLWLKPGVTVSNKMAQEKQAPTNMVFIPTGFPLNSYTSTDLASNVSKTYPTSGLCWAGNPCTSTVFNRTPLFVWNDRAIRWDAVNPQQTIEVGKYYAVNTFTSTIFASGYKGNVNVHRGVANNSNLSVTLIGTHGTEKANNGTLLEGNVINQNFRNVYNQRYSTYIEDSYVGSANYATSVHWGKRFTGLSNPFTCNIDLSYINKDEGTVTLNGTNINDGINIGTELWGIEKYTASTTINGAIASSNWTRVAVTNNAGTWTGDPSSSDFSALLIRPVEGFFLKLRNTVTADLTVSNFFNDNIKTFNLTGTSIRANELPNGNGTVTKSAKSSSKTIPTFQLGLHLYDNKGDYTAARTYIVAASNLVNGPSEQVEMESDVKDNNTLALYTKQELAKGVGLDPNLTNSRYFINQINTSYVKNAIPLYFQVDEAKAADSYTIKGELGYGVSKIKTTNFTEPEARFYFHDKQEGKYMLINQDFSYTFTQKSDTGDRFEIFFGNPIASIETPTTTTTTTVAGVVDVPVVTNNGGATTNTTDNITTVYKGTDGKFSVRFAKNWSNATVTVYTTVGQIIHMGKKINTANDYVLPLDNKTASYIIKIANENGEVVTRKIIK